MDKYIECEAVFDVLFGQYCASCDETEQALNAAIEEIKLIPAADVAPVKHGQWVFYHYELYGCYYECSNCKYESNKKTNYCPNCGAKMDGESNV